MALYQLNVFIIAMSKITVWIAFVTKCWMHLICYEICRYTIKYELFTFGAGVKSIPLYAAAPRMFPLCAKN